jgi:hypothetical protein
MLECRECPIGAILSCFARSVIGPIVFARCGSWPCSVCWPPAGLLKPLVALCMSAQSCTSRSRGTPVERLISHRLSSHGLLLFSPVYPVAARFLLRRAHGCCRPLLHCLAARRSRESMTPDRFSLTPRPIIPGRRQFVSTGRLVLDALFTSDLRG